MLVKGPQLDEAHLKLFHPRVLVGFPGFELGDAGDKGRRYRNHGSFVHACVCPFPIDEVATPSTDDSGLTTHGLPAIVLILVLILGSGCGGGDSPEGAATTSTLSDEVTVTTERRVSPYGPDESRALLAAVDAAGVRDEMSDADWLDGIHGACALLEVFKADVVKHAEAASNFYTVLVRQRGEDVAKGIVAGTGIACPVTGAILAVTASRS